MDLLERLVENFRKTVEAQTARHLGGGTDANDFISSVRAQHLQCLQQIMRIRIENRKRHQVLDMCEHAEAQAKRIANEAFAAADMTGRIVAA